MTGHDDETGEGAVSNTSPDADWSGAWAQLTGYVSQARDDGNQIDPDRLLDYMTELRREALAPIHEWMRQMGETR